MATRYESTIHDSLLIFYEMRWETTLFTELGYIDVANTSQGGVTENSHNESGGSGNSETGEVLCYPRIFLIERQVAF